MGKVREIGAKLYNPFYPRWFDRAIFDFIDKLPKEDRILNVGSGNTNIKYGVVNLDIVPFDNVHIIADAHSIPIDDNYYDCVFCSALLEHTKRPWEVAYEIQRVLKWGGYACIQTPFLEAIHDDSDYFRFTFKGLISLFPDLKIIKSGVSCGPSQVLADLLRVYPCLIFENTILDKPVKLAMSWIAKPFQLLDFLIKDKPSMDKYARAYYIIGQKVLK